ncbi:hypothetical protein EXIGLDRAFT_708058, partial [Exidia glandulosa HHB12029]
TATASSGTLVLSTSFIDHRTSPLQELWNADMIAPFAQERLQFVEHPGESHEDLPRFDRVSMPTNRAQRGTKCPNGSGTSSTTHAQQGALSAHQLPSQHAPVAAGAQTEVQSTHAPAGRNSPEAAEHHPDAALRDVRIVVKGSDDLQVEADADMDTESLDAPPPILLMLECLQTA